MAVYRLEFPQMELLNQNGRQHHMVRSRINKHIRETGLRLAKEAGIPRLKAVKVRVYLYPGDNRKRDSSNVTFPSGKAAIDGSLVDSGVLPDDDDRYVRSVELLRGDRIIKGGRLVLEIEEIDECP